MLNDMLKDDNAILWVDDEGTVKVGILLDVEIEGNKRVRAQINTINTNPDVYSRYFTEIIPFSRLIGHVSTLRRLGKI